MGHPFWWGAAFERLAAVTTTRLAVVRWDGGDDAVVEWTNPSSAALVGLPAADVAGRRLSEVYPARYVAEIVEQFRQARAAGAFRYEVVRELPAGRRTLDAVTVAIGGDLFVSAAQDVTAEREAQRRLDEVSRLTGTGLYHWNLAEDSLAWTDEMFRLFGYEPGEVEPSRALYLEHVHPDDRGAVEAMGGAAEGGGPSRPLHRHRVVRADGDVRTVEVRVQPVVGEAGGLLYELGVVRDVTDEVELQRHEELAHRAADQQRTALTVHDRVVQALATVVLALDLDELETARAEAMAAVTAAQTVVTELLGEVAAVQGAIDPGALRAVVDDGGGA
ncbi:PAS domain-containing protein [Egicoccus sp. AB-alg6-2]|uniref:PAS domain-containing protein n=1 Tax=Egicoccus sp. AB-alg6-2 TaxID=3242692 RepID=UPI00359E32A8